MVITLQIIACILSIGLFLYTLFWRNTAFSRYWPLLLISVFFCALGYLFEQGAHSADATLMALRIQYIGQAFYAPLLALYIHERIVGSIDVRLIGVLFILPVLTLVTASLYPHTLLFFRSIEYMAAPISRPIIEQGVFYYIHAGYSLAIVALSVLQPVRMYMKSRGVIDKNLFYIRLFIAAGISCACLLLHCVDFSRTIMPVYAPLLAASILLFALPPLHADHPADIRPFVHEHMIANISEGYILLDSERRLIDANAIAMRYFPELKHLLPGGSIESAPGFPLDILDLPYLNHEFPLLVNEEEARLRAYISPIGQEGRVVCTSILFSDITPQPEVEIEPPSNVSTHDPTTSILSYSTFLSNASLYFDLLLRIRQPMIVMTLELDHFKRMKDRFGQPTCDEALRIIASILKGRLRRTDLCGRYDQTKLCALLPAINQKNARRLANYIRTKIEAYAFPAQADPIHHPQQIRFFSAQVDTFQATVSIGIAELDASKHFTLDDLIADADAALYMAKDAGHNTIVAI